MKQILENLVLSNFPLHVIRLLIQWDDNCFISTKSLVFCSNQMQAYVASSLKFEQQDE